MISFSNEYSMEASPELPVSIVVSAKNEEKNIIALLHALCAQNYKAEMFEVVVVDDNSSDNTFLLASQFSAGRSSVKIIKAQNKILPGKKGALSLGISCAKNPYILITDADCKPEPDWIRTFAVKFKEGYDLLFGIAPFLQNNRLINKIACFEELRTSILSFTLANFGMPYSAAARSFGFTKKAFDKLGGYNNTTETLSGDDDLLIREAVKHKLKIGTITSGNSKVYSETKTTLRDYLLQKARHTSTANYYLLRHKVILALWHLLNLAFMFSPLLTGISKLFWFPFLAKVTADVVIVQSAQKKFGYRFGIGENIILQITYEILLIINYLNSFFRKDKW